MNAKNIINAATKTNETTALVEAVRKGNLTVAKMLIQAGADVNQANKRGETPLYKSLDADLTNNYMLHILQKAGARLEPVVALAAYREETRKMNVLKDRGASASDAIIIAAQKYGVNSEAVKLIEKVFGVQKHKAAVRALVKYDDPKTAKALMSDTIEMELVKAFDDWGVEVAEKIAAMGVKMDVVLVQFVNRDNVEGMKWAQEKGGKDAALLDYAISNDSVRCVEYMMQQDPSLVNTAMDEKSGQTPLIFAAACNSERTAEKLIEMGADANIKDKEGYTALMGAAVNGNAKIAGMILGMSEDDVVYD